VAMLGMVRHRFLPRTGKQWVITILFGQSAE
jgi:hypothetical protein